MNRTLRILTATLVAGPALALSVAPTALAGGGTHDLDSRSAYGQWLEVGATEGLPGNIHRGAISANWDDDASSVDYSQVIVETWSCPDEVEPPALGAIYDDAGVVTPCTFKGAFDSPISDAAVTVDARLGTAQVTGAVTLGTVSGPLDVDFVGSGQTERQVWIDHEAGRDGWTSRTVLSQRAATFSGEIALLGLGDDADDVQVLGDLKRMTVAVH